MGTPPICVRKYISIVYLGNVKEWSGGGCSSWKAGNLKGEMRINPAAQEDLELVTVCLLWSESGSFRRNDRMEVKGYDDGL
jgi:hypothetical protein